MNILKKLYKKMIKYKQESEYIFDFPRSFIALLSNPFYFVRKNLYFHIKSMSPYLKGKLLDFGCGCKPYRKILTYSSEYIGVDIEISGHNHTNESIDVYYDGKTLPFESEHFDSVFSSEVFEHVINFEEILPELYRVLKRGGYMVATVPFIWNEHEVPYDFTRYTSYGIRSKLESAGFKIVEMRKSTLCIEMIFQQYMEYLRYNFYRKARGKLAMLLFQEFIIFPIAVLGLIINILLPENDSFYGDNIVLCKKANIQG